MKKIKFLLGILMVSAGACLCTSCDDDDDTPSVMVTPSETAYTIEVATNVPATFEYNNAATGAKFTTTTGGTLRVIPVDSKYVGQDIKIVLGENKDIKLNVTLIEKPSSNVKVNDANNSTTDVTVNGSTNGSSIVIPGSTTITGSDGNSDMGIGVYATSGTTEEPTEANQNVTSDVLVAVCEPDGAQFTEPVTITVPAPEAEGLNFTCINDAQGDNANVTVAANSLSAKVSHFSNWTFSLNATVVSIATETETVLDTKILVKDGETKFDYSVWRGMETSSTGIVKTFLLSQFGSEKSRVAKTGSLVSTGEGSAHIRVIQDKKVITYRSGSRTFTATIYGAVKVEVVDITYDTTGHSGGIGGVS